MMFSAQYLEKKIISIDPYLICLVKLKSQDLVLLEKADLVILDEMEAKRQEDEAVGSLQHSLLIKAWHKATKKIDMERG